MVTSKEGEGNESIRPLYDTCESVPECGAQALNSTKTASMMDSITPRCFLDFLPWVPVGIYRVN